MKNGLLKVANKLNKKHKQRKWWQRTVRAMGTVVVFCTTYALILPAITMEQEPICGIEAHEHGEGCYTQQPVAAFVCDLEEGANLIHSHEAICCDAQNVLICPLPEIKEHTHDDSCYSLSEQTTCGYAHVHSDACVTVQTVQVCGQEETSGHTHSDACTTQVNLICQIPEEAGHTHSEDCGSVTTNLICTEAEGETHSHSEGCYETIRTPCEIPESAGHTHTDGCYETLAVSCEIPESAGHTHNETCYESQEVPCEKTTDDGHVHTESCYTKQLNCNLAEVKLHTHDSITCYSADGTLTCTIPEYRKHVHGESCLVQTEQMQDVLTCGLEVHVHEEKCYPVEEEDQYAYICGFGVHAHLETCYNEAGELVCSIPEHIHDASCIVEDLDLTADVETAEQWEETFADVVLTGNWPKDILAVAETQLDYKESEKNLILEDGQLKGYTRYGAWYGEPYGKWDAMFVSFCLNYGGVEDFPLESDADRWIAALEEKQLYQTSDTYSPKPGDLIFIDFDQTVEAAEAGEEVPVTADLVGIVAERIPATEEKPAQYQFIAGDCDNQVSYMTCDVDDITIVGYGQMPSGEISYMTYEGTGFTVTVTLGKDAGIPETAQLAVREILPETPDYAFYYSQSLEALAGDSAEEQPEISFARFFDITFVDNGTPIEPAIPVDVVISYSNAIPVKEEENGKIVHFAKDGVEVLETDTSLADPSKEEAGILSAITELFTDKTEQVDTFRFTQNSFSVSGTVVASRAAGVTVYPANLTSLDGTGGTSYVIYTYYNYRYYAIAAPAANANNSKLGSMIQLTQNADGSFSWSGNQNVLWNFAETAANTYDITNENGRYLHAFWNNNGSDVGVIGTNSKGTAIIRDGNRFRVKHPSSNVYVSISNGYFYPTTNQNNATYFYIAEVPSNVYHVWFDGTNGGMMSYYGASDTYQAVSRNDNTITLPTTAQSSTKYDYKLNGWYDIKTNQYYKPGEEVTIHQNTVFYADWVAATYDVGQDNEYVVESLNTDDFITTHVFDYNNLFNMQSVTHTGSVSAIGHKETWTIVNNGTVPYQDANTLGFVFVDYDSDGEITYPLDRDTTNINQGEAITADILEEVKTASGGKDLLDLLFNPATSVIGKNYVGKGNYLFQYMDSTTENYDGIHDGYYYLDARLNAASYNKTEERFYLYDYLERTSDSNKDRGVGQYSDFLPFNSPYIFDADQLDPYTDSIATPGYEYDAKDGENSFKEFNSVDDANTNYFFGIRTDIEFFLTNNAGTTDEYGNYGNISTRGEHMIFDFHGDDDVWVFIDDELVLDIGGLHGVMFGQIDFSTGTVISGKDGGTTTSVSFTELLGHNITEGTHNMTVYYMERGSSQSNCAIYFNIAPRYDLEITKEDIYTTALLDGAEFTIYSCEGCANTCVECLQGDCTIESHKASPLTTCATHGADLQYAELWTSQEAHNLDMDDKVVDDAIHTITTVNGKAYCWGLAAGKTYYIKETLPPHDYDPGYPQK